MRYVMIFLAVLVVLLLMIGFMFLVIRQVSDRVTGQVNGRYMRELSVFDRLYEEKKKKLEELEEQEKLYGVNLMKKEGAAENQPVKAAVEIPAAVHAVHEAMIPAEEENTLEEFAWAFGDDAVEEME